MRHGVDVLGHIVAVSGEVQLVEELAVVVKAAAAVLGERVEIK